MNTVLIKTKICRRLTLDPAVSPRQRACWNLTRFVRVWLPTLAPCWGVKVPESWRLRRKFWRSLPGNRKPAKPAGF